MIYDVHCELGNVPTEMVFALFKLVCGLWFPVLQNQSAEMLPKSSLLGNLLLQSQDLRVTFFNFHRGKRLRFRPSSAFFLGRDVLWRFSWKYLAMLKLWIWLNLYVPNIYMYIYTLYFQRPRAKRPYKTEVVQPPQNIGVVGSTTNWNKSCKSCSWRVI